MTDAVKAKVSAITRETLVPVGVVVALMFGAYSIGADRALALSRIETNELANTRQDAELDTLDQKLDRLGEAINRIEVELGTKPVVPDPEG